MRNLFDQYEHPENRLTHALVCCFAQDSRLLRDFVRYITGKRIAARDSIRIVEQTLPGEDEGTEEEAPKRGLPDAWIFNEDDSWSLIIESKKNAPVSRDQHEQHGRKSLRTDRLEAGPTQVSGHTPVKMTRSLTRKEVVK